MEDVKNEEEKMLSKIDLGMKKRSNCTGEWEKTLKFR